ncbi:hypothetical protein BJY01DRAFT_240600 [Aspergillus pseudoustus]|uniref:DUF3500 domain-containing protein n=1 Tax=Aspergillus pseudoustus TaxID=1810923 RepID=A0ABR4IPE8_9EURO
MACFRQWLDLQSPQVLRARGQTAVSYSDKMFSDIPLVAEINSVWDKQWKEPFRGVTTDGTPIPHLFPDRDDELDIARLVAAADAMLATVNSTERQKLMRPLGAPEQRAWSNPELYVHRFGLRLDEASEASQGAILSLIQATLSPEGFHKALTATRINGFLGDLVGAPGVMNERSYNFMLFGEPSNKGPWGWSMYGHHLCLNVLLFNCQIVLSPTFTGAEPNVIDSGPFTGSTLFTREETLGLRFMQQLPPHLRAKAQIFKDMHDTAMPDWRWNPADQRHLCGAFQDNRVIPYEGVCLAELDPSFTVLLLDIVEEFHLYLTKTARQNRLKQVLEHRDQTFFSWIGQFGDNDAFYYRIQSPVIICEFDHHSGVFLSNPEPAKFHTHTIVRTPNGGDYGYALLDRWMSNN